MPYVLRLIPGALQTGKHFACEVFLVIEKWVDSSGNDHLGFGGVRDVESNMRPLLFADAAKP